MWRTGDAVTLPEAILRCMYMCCREFEEAAIGVLNECYRRDKTMSRQLMVRDLEIWGSTPLMIADAASEMDFMGHSCCQTKLNEIWKGKMALYTSTGKVKGSDGIQFRTSDS